MPKQRKIGWEEYAKLCELLVDNEIPVIAKKLKISTGAVYNRLDTLRNLLDETQAAINKIRTFQRISKRVRKFTTKGGVPDNSEE